MRRTQSRERRLMLCFKWIEYIIEIRLSFIESIFVTGLELIEHCLLSTLKRFKCCGVCGIQRRKPGLLLREKRIAFCFLLSLKFLEGLLSRYVSVRARIFNHLPKLR